MHSALLKRFAKLERQKEALLYDVSILPEAQLRFRPAPTTWSILDILDHLVRVETATLAMVRLNLPAGQLITMKDRMGALMVTSVMKTTIRVKVPAGVTVVIPGDVADVPEVSARWRSARDSMAKLLHELNARQLCIGLFRHPVGGWMNMAQTLGFLSAHLHHHVYQVNRLRGNRS